MKEISWALPGIFVLFFSLAACADEIPPITNDDSPMWSPDEEKIVFASSRSGTKQVYVMNADGTDVQRLTDRDGYDGDPSWSPDGSKIAFCSDRDGNFEIYVMDADGSNPVNLTNHPARDCDTPSWSPDGTRLTFVSTRDGDWQNNLEDNYDVYIMNADGSGQFRLTQNRGYDLSTGQAWTPDGKQIIFCSSGDEPFVQPEGADWRTLYTGFEIYRIDADGQNQTRLTFTYGEDSYPFISPDGTMIYYARYLKDTGTNYDMYTMSADGKVVTQITDSPNNEGPATWSPDGAKIVYGIYDSVTQSIWMADADGSNPVKLTNKDQ